MTSKRDRHHVNAGKIIAKAGINGRKKLGRRLRNMIADALRDEAKRNVFADKPKPPPKRNPAQIDLEDLLRNA